MAGNFIQGAIKRPGALTAKAKAAGMTVRAFAVAHQHDKGVTGQECRFYLNVLAKTTKPSGSKLATVMGSKPAAGRPAFGSPAFDAKYAIKKFGR